MALLALFWALLAIPWSGDSSTFTVVVAFIPGLNVWWKSLTRSNRIVWVPAESVSGMPFGLVQIVI
jgi:hypothetical protein